MLKSISKRFQCILLGMENISRADDKWNKNKSIFLLINLRKSLFFSVYSGCCWRHSRISIELFHSLASLSYVSLAVLKAFQLSWRNLFALVRSIFHLVGSFLFRRRWSHFSHHQIRLIEFFTTLELNKKRTNILYGPKRILLIDDILHHNRKNWLNLRWMSVAWNWLNSIW